VKNNLKQTIMLKLALEEVGIDPNKCKISIDHDKGRSYVNTVELSIIFPKQWFEYTKNLHTLEKEYNFYFNGNIGKGSSRQKLLQNFISRDDCVVVWSNDGRAVSNKSKYNKEYFTGLAKSNYGLCPHQPDWKGDLDALWTYRFIECLMSKTVPVNFRETPLSTKFTNGFYFVWNNSNFTNETNATLLNKNYNLAFDRFTLSLEKINAIKTNMN
jgi:hypothetical protein